jgi:hypothetical protein
MERCREAARLTGELPSREPRTLSSNTFGVKLISPEAAMNSGGADCERDGPGRIEDSNVPFPHMQGVANVEELFLPVQLEFV